MSARDAEPGVDTYHDSSLTAKAASFPTSGERPTAPAAARSGYIATLDGWRAIAVALVFFGHSALGVCSRNPTASVCAATTIGLHGVSIFFALSGFLITTRLVEERVMRGRVSLRAFYVRRAFRILPAALLYLGVLALLATVRVVTVSGLAWFASLVFMREYLPTALGDWYTGHFWSLGVEEKFYLLWPAMVVFTPRRWLPRATVLVAVLVGIWRVVDGHWRILSNLTGRGFDLITRWDTRFDALLWGCVLALILTHAPARAWLTARMTRFVRVCIVVAFCAAILLTRYSPRDALILETLLAPLLLATTMLVPNGAVGRMFEHPVMRWIGLRSFGIYLWQQLLIAVPGRNDLGIVQAFPLNVLLLFAVAAVSYRYLERPLIRVGHRLAQPVTPGRSDVAA